MPEVIMYKGENIYNKRFNGLVVKKRLRATSRSRHLVVEILCDCGNSKPMFMHNIMKGIYKGCGCNIRKHGHAMGGKNKKDASPEYRVWSNMMQACRSPSTSRYKALSEKGITITDRWLGEDGFIRFLHDMGERPSKLYWFRRIDQEKDFTPENCHWSTTRGRLPKNYKETKEMKK